LLARSTAAAGPCLLGCSAAQEPCRQALLLLTLVVLLALPLILLRLLLLLL
jgi:hypothetical protein